MRSGLVVDDALYIATEFLHRVEPESPNTPVQIEHVLELERNRLWGCDYEQVERDPVLSRAHHLEARIAPLQPLKRGFARPIPVFVIHHQRRGTLTPAMLNQWAQCFFDERIHVGPEDDSPASLFQVARIRV